MAGELIVLRDETGREYRVELSATGEARIGGSTLNVQPNADGSVRVTGPSNVLVWTRAVGHTRWIFVDGQVFTFEVERAAARRRGSAGHHATLTAPMPATVRKLLVSPGDSVAKGEVLIVLEAMKMELPIRATADGRVEKVQCREGDLVQPGVILIELAD